MAVSQGRNRGHLGDQALGGQLPLIGVFHIQLVVIKRGHRTDHSRQDGHGVRIVMEATDEIVDFFVHHRVIRDVTLKLSVLRLRGKVSV